MTISTMQKKHLKTFNNLSSQKQQLKIKGSHLNTVKAIYEKPIGNTILSGRKLKKISLRQKHSKDASSVL